MPGLGWTLGLCWVGIYPGTSSSPWRGGIQTVVLCLPGLGLGQCPFQHPCWASPRSPQLDHWVISPLQDWTHTTFQIVGLLPIHHLQGEQRQDTPGITMRFSCLFWFPSHLCAPLGPRCFLHPCLGWCCYFCPSCSLSYSTQPGWSSWSASQRVASRICGQLVSSFPTFLSSLEEITRLFFFLILLECSCFTVLY